MVRTSPSKLGPGNAPGAGYWQVMFARGKERNVSTLQTIPLNSMQANPKLDLGGHEDKRNTQTDGDLKMEDRLAGEEEDHGKMEGVRQDKRANNDQSASYTCMELLKNKQTV